jgi:hypothetical protein
MLYDYISVSKVLKEQAEIYERMETGGGRQFKSYFKVTFYGKELGAFA